MEAFQSPSQADERESVLLERLWSSYWQYLFYLNCIRMQCKSFGLFCIGLSQLKACVYNVAQWLWKSIWHSLILQDCPHKKIERSVTLITGTHQLWETEFRKTTNQIVQKWNTCIMVQKSIWVKKKKGYCNTLSTVTLSSNVSAGLQQVDADCSCSWGPFFHLDLLESCWCFGSVRTVNSHHRFSIGAWSPRYARWVKQVSRSQSSHPLDHPDGVWPTCSGKKAGDLSSTADGSKPWRHTCVTSSNTAVFLWLKHYLPNAQVDSLKIIMWFAGFFFSCLSSVIVEAYLWCTLQTSCSIWIYVSISVVQDS